MKCQPARLRGALRRGVGAATAIALVCHGLLLQGRPATACSAQGATADYVGRSCAHTSTTDAFECTRMNAGEASTVASGGGASRAGTLPALAAAGAATAAAAGCQ